MPYFNDGLTPPKVKFYRKKWFIATISVSAILILAGGVAFWKIENILNKISEGNVFTSLLHAVPGVKDELGGEAEGRINILLLGMRGEEVIGGGLLADTIMLASIKPSENKVALISVPRDLYVTMPGTQTKEKINAAYFRGEENGMK